MKVKVALSECVLRVCVSDLGLSFSTVQGVEMVNSALWGRPWVGENLEDVKIVAQSVGSHQQHSCNKHTHTHGRSLHGWRQRWDLLLLLWIYSVQWVLLPLARMLLYFAFGVCLSCFMLWCPRHIFCVTVENLSIRSAHERCNDHSQQTVKNNGEPNFI